MKKALLSLASLLVITSCTNEENIIEGEVTPVADAPVFTASIEGTRTTISEGSSTGKKKVEWLSTDKVFVAGFDDQNTLTLASSYSVTPSEPATGATLNPETVMYNTGAGIAKVFATYPASISFLYDLPEANYPLVANNYRDVYLPSTQTYNESNISQVAPMAAEVTGGVTDLKFKNITALLAINISSSQISSVNQIKVSTDKQLVDRFTIDENFDCTSLYTEAEFKTVTLDCTEDGEATTIASGETRTFYVSIPANTYSYINIEVINAYVSMSMRTTAESIEVKRNKIYPINFVATKGTAKATINGEEVDVPWVQLYDDGPKWAAFNLGATNVNEAGGTYKQGQTSVHGYRPYSLGLDIQYTEYDTAKDLWGLCWQMPTADQYTDLGTKTNMQWIEAGESGYTIQGILFKAKTGTIYEGNSIFFPITRKTTENVTELTIPADYYWTSISPRKFYLAHKSNGGFIHQTTGQASDVTYPYPVRAIIR